ncbi:MAG: sterol desaturase family protein [Gammaproteobacteria bacterium]|nr:sterol desaturase family protein [Gammaproteobacteria bacterium]
MWVFIVHFLGSITVTYYFTSVVQTLFHRWFGHKNTIPKLFKGHALGHHLDYRSIDLLGDTYIESEAHVIWYYAIPLAPPLITVLILGSPGVIGGFIVSLMFTIWWNIYLHRQYHTSNVIWERFRWFHAKREAHFQHHRDVRSNFAMVEYWLDDLMQTRK